MVKKDKEDSVKVKKNKMYFTKETEKAIIEYNATNCQQKRNKIYSEKIQYSFEKLAENILNTFKFVYLEVSPLDIQKEVVSFLISNIHKFDPNKKENLDNKHKKVSQNKAFAYFSVVAKNYLILYNNSNYNRWKNQTNIDEEKEDCETFELQYDDEFEKRQKYAIEYINQFVAFWDNNIKNIFKKEKDLIIADAIVELFRQHERLENFNKKAIYLYLRDMTSCDSQQITKILNKMKDYHKIMERQFKNNGVINIG